MKPSIYIAAPLAEFSSAEAAAYALREAGYRVVSTWHSTMRPGCCDPVDACTRQDTLLGNVQELHRADAMVAWTASGIPRATIGEIAYMLAHGRPVVWIQGPDRHGANIWDAHPLVEIVASVRVPDVMAALKRAEGRIDRDVRDVPAWLEAPLRELSAAVEEAIERWQVPRSLIRAAKNMRAAIDGRRNEA